MNENVLQSEGAELLYNPLPDPVPGRREEMEFPITDVSEDAARDEGPGDAFDASKPQEEEQDDFERETSPGDDYDYPVDESDDFDI